MSPSHIASQMPILIRWPKRDGHFASLAATEHVFCARSEKGPICSGLLNSGQTTQQSTYDTDAVFGTQRVQPSAL